MEFQGIPDALNRAPFEGMKDRVENALLTGYEAQAHRPRRTPPAQDPVAETLRSELRDLRHTMVEAYGLGIETWRVPDEASFDDVSLAAGA